MSDQQQPQEEIQDVNKLIAERKHKLAALREDGFMFPNDFRRDSISSDVIAKYDHLSKEELEAQKITGNAPDDAVAAAIILQRYFDALT